MRRRLDRRGRASRPTPEARRRRARRPVRRGRPCRPRRPPPNRAASLPKPPIFFSRFIAVDISWCILRSLLTSCTVRPAPLATRILRLALISSGRVRSFGVIEPMIASMWTSTLLSTPDAAIAACAFFMPGSIPARPVMPPIRCIWASWFAQIVEVELALRHLAGERLGLVGLDRLLRTLDQADDVAHAEDAAGDAIGMKAFEPVQPLADAGELDRLAGDRAHRQRRAAARIAVEAGQHDAGQRHLLGEALGDVDRVLAGQRIDDEQDLVAGSRRRRSPSSRPSRPGRRGGGPRCRASARHSPGASPPAAPRRAMSTGCWPGDDRQGRDVGLARRARASCSCAAGRATSSDAISTFLRASLGEPLGDLGGGGRLARALEADHQDHGAAA